MSELSCDICGRPDVRAVVLIEGAKMLACGSCMRGGKILHRLTDEGETPPIRQMVSGGQMQESREIVEGYGRIIKKARDQMRLPVSVIAEKVNEKESYLEAIEGERIVPTFEVARKLEKELKIKIIEEAGPSIAPSASSQPGKFSPPTLADALLSDTRKRKKER